MACREFVVANQNNTQRVDTITDILKRIDKMQREAINANQAGNCNSCIIAPVYNTKPIAVYLCNTVLTAETNAGNTVNRFRVEEVRGETVILRLLENVGNQLTCTNETITCRISCICAIQCFDPITCVINCPLAV